MVITDLNTIVVPEAPERPLRWCADCGEDPAPYRVAGALDRPVCRECRAGYCALCGAEDATTTEAEMEKAGDPELLCDACRHQAAQPMHAAVAEADCDCGHCEGVHQEPDYDSDENGYFKLPRPCEMPGCDCRSYFDPGPMPEPMPAMVSGVTR